MDQSLIIVAYLVTVVALILGFIFMRGRLMGGDSPEPTEQKQRPRVNPDRKKKKERGKKKKKRGLNRIRQEAAEEEDEEEDAEAVQNREERRRQEREAKRQQREAMRKMEEDKAAAKRKKADKYAAKLEARREKREAERLAAEKEAAKKKKKQKEEEDQLYEDWKGEIELEEEGTEVLDAAATEALLTKFVEYVKKYKVVVLDDLATEFEMKTKDVVNHIENMEKDGTLTGIMDETGGKFIYITEDEMKQVAAFIQTKGRVSVDDIVAQSNKLIDLSGMS
uniref:DDRGK domain-containing protein 1 n=1 Tax=Lotharella globosa TaxID=91324 RepID=A0A6U2Z104_9EUKA|mmetsp:Transcript_17715/g.35736  ORF Transcript_17715/g.35736 Transcript_17715/m.35736 type:complete len:280 (+) Transcript_17715:52-891(+)|eukprot:CAMPEP_0167791778 /NCGR_PEP_ID=MMETSP0111_2-20121227/12139_1 /TAXON_ID=91324 /ORGANISM="Lotharella globosa, Strain CCCM811" /LENGTH=279 /DNA_ID=CAMNT_0007684513 /DNA_START=49 /DNA_END=888 /DNA_ORIENTATION=+